MKKFYSLTVFLFLYIICLFPSSAQILNGSFEEWNGSNAVSWTTVDSGILLNQETAKTKEGNSSAKITVNTSTQSNTDFLQTIAVTPGQSYTFSVWVYHTEGGVRARLYVDGYRDYSNSSQLNQWQQITFQYTPSTSNIEVGLRFYDVSGFDGSEVVYVDSFAPATVSEPVPTEPTCTDVALTLTTDNYGSETSWVIKDKNGTTLYSGNNYNSNITYSGVFCLTDGDYSFVISDAYGDGICCAYGQGSYSLSSEGSTLGSGGSFSYSETVNFTIGATNPNPEPELGNYYSSASGLSGYTLKTELYNIIKGHNSQGYNAIWGFYATHELDQYYENDGTILDIYSEKPSGADAYSWTKTTDQCGNYSGEGGCYNREHSFPKSWFGGTVEPMNSDIHHIFATDGYVNSKRSSYPFGEVGAASFVSTNGSKVGSPVSGLGYNGTVFEPIDEFKGDLARAAFYMATRYENVIGGWETISSYGNDILDGSSNKVFETWTLNLLISWHNNDPVSAKEIARNEAAFAYQGNRNPFVDHPEFVTSIWGNSSARTSTETFATSYQQEQLIVEHGITDPVNVVVFDASGRKIIEYTGQADQSPVTELSVLLTPNSLYMVKVYTKDKMMIKKIVINK